MGLSGSGDAPAGNSPPRLRFLPRAGMLL